VRRSIKGESERFVCEYRYIGGDGEWHWARQHGLALRDASGRAYRMAGSTGDITEQRETAREICNAAGRDDLSAVLRMVVAVLSLTRTDEAALIVCGGRH